MGVSPRIVAAGAIFEDLDRRTQVRLFAALLGLVILGLTTMLLAWLAARAIRRYMRRGEFPRDDRTNELGSDDDWARKPLNTTREL